MTRTGGVPAIRLRSVAKSYRVGGTPVHALCGLDLDVRRGEFCSVMGPSGAGKTTLLNVLGCLELPDSGDYWLGGERVSELRDHELARIRNRAIGMVYQSFNLLATLTAVENVELPLVYAGVRHAERRRRAQEALERVGLSERSEHSPARLSGGERQRVAIARALVRQPQILLADEPTGNLDSGTAAGIMQLLADLHGSGNTILCVTHDPQVAGQADRIVRVLDGRIVHADDEKVHASVAH
ncbi:MAG TPA: ABC transporter ATP-binding protein [Woeseiaceae bacterium]|nr:ABC transporter ATP-binding protein [Woeseiaceae bacterium]